MKKIWVSILLVLLPTVVFSQWSGWSIAVSGSAGISEANNSSTKYYKENTKGKIGTDVSFTARYAIRMFYLSSGVGFQAFTSQSGYVMRSDTVSYGGLRPDFSYSNLYIPLTVGFRYDRWKLYPLVELGANVHFPTGLKDRIVVGNDVTDVVGSAKFVTLSFVAQGGLGLSLGGRCALEAKLRYSTSSDVSKEDKRVRNNTKSTWTYTGGQLSMVVKL